MKNQHIKLYSDIVGLLAKFSNAEKIQVGALLLRDKRIIATGYNGQPHGQPHKAVHVDGHDVSTIHAEMNCIMFAAKHGIKIDGCEMFCSYFPCANCIKMLYQAGIKKLYYINDYTNGENIYKDLIEIRKV